MSVEQQVNQIDHSQPFESPTQEVSQTPRELRKKVAHLEKEVEQLKKERVMQVEAQQLLKQEVEQLQTQLEHLQQQPQPHIQFEQKVTQELQKLKSQLTDRKWPQWQQVTIAVLVTSVLVGLVYNRLYQFEHMLYQQDATTKAAVEDRISKLEYKITELVKDLSAGRAGNQPLTVSGSLDPPELTMTRFHIYKNEASRWTSKPMYSDRQGYKICLGVIASGTSFGKGTHISVFIHFMRGRYDDSLKWPFRGIIRFRLLDQLTGEDHKNGSVVYDDNVADSVCTRVTEGEVGKGKWGYVQFIPHADLEPKYLVNNTLVFQIIEVELH